MKIIAAFVGLLLAVTGFSVASATEPTDEPCVPSEGAAGYYTDWVDSGPVVTVHDSDIAPGQDSEFERWDFLGSSKHIVQSATEDQVVFDYWQRYSWTGGPWDDSQGPPPFPDERWQPNVQGDPHGVGVEGAYFRSHGSSGKGDWFYLEAVTKTIPGQEEISHIDYFWQKQVRTYVPPVPPVDCPEEPENPEEPPTPEEPEKPTKPEPPVTVVKKSPPAKVEVPTVVDSGL